LVQADPDDLAEAGRRRERAAVVELDPARHAVSAPEPSQCGQHARVTAVFDDLDPGVVGADVDLGERQKPRATP
jgi:hypothetical protein